jgi:hypothetical protein
MFTRSEMPKLSSRSDPARRPSERALPRALVLRVGRIVRVALAPSRVAAEPAVGDASIAVSYGVRRREFVSADAPLHIVVRGRSCADDTYVIQVDATPAFARSLQAGGCGQRTATGLVQRSTGYVDCAASHPQAAAARVALDRLATVRQQPQSHPPMLRSRQPYGG